MRQYSRKFITLVQERSEYSHNGRQCLGRCIIESKEAISKIIVYVQGLKPQVLYKLYVVCCENNKSIGVPIGTINVDDRGKCETKWELNADNVACSSIAIERFNVVAVCVSKNKDVDPILVGFTENELIWKNNFTEYSEMGNNIQNTNHSPARENDCEDKRVDSESLDTEKDIAQNISCENDNVVSTNITASDKSIEESSTFKDSLTNANDEKDILEKDTLEKDSSESGETDNTTNDMNSNEHKNDDTAMKNAETKQTSTVEKSEKAASAETTANSTNQTDNTKQNNNKDETISSSVDTLEAAHMAFKEIIHKFNIEMEILQNYKLYDAQETINNITVESKSEGIQAIDALYTCNMPVNPFHGKFDDIVWIHISLKELALLGCVEYMNTPFIVSGYRKHRHLLLGKQTIAGKEKYILGVPEKYTYKDKLITEELGFIFAGCDGGDVSEECFGYWLLDICDK